MPATKDLARKYKREAFMKLRHHEGSLEEYNNMGIDDVIKEDGFMDDDDDDTTVGGSIDSAQRAAAADHGGKEYDGWKPKFRYCKTVFRISMCRLSCHAFF